MNSGQPRPQATQNGSTPQSRPSSHTMQEKILRDGARLRMGNLAAGLWSNLQGAIQTHRWAERDTAAKHKQLHGESGTSEMDELEMPNLSLGDQYHPSPVIVPTSQQSPGAGLLLSSALLGAGIPMAGLAGWLLNQPKEPPQQEPPPAVEYNPDDYSIGFGKLTDE